MLAKIEAGPGNDTELAARLMATRAHSLALAAPLSAEDQVVQASADASPTKWHLAHTTWFFETFVLTKHLPDYQIFDSSFGYCFNSYYEGEGPRHPRHARGLLTRPSHEAVLAYRAHIDEGLRALLARPVPQDVATLLELGIQHEQQHQELLLTDILALFAQNPLRPAYKAYEETPAPQGSLQHMMDVAGGIVRIGHEGLCGHDKDFAFDNESPAHEVLLQPFRLARGLVTNAQWLTFMREGGYTTPQLWLADGWHWVNGQGNPKEAISAPLYWEERDGQWVQMTLHGLRPIDPKEPVCHISYYEADAFARWAGLRLPTEFEWEWAARSLPDLVNVADTRWQWTSSAYLPYPGYKAPPGAVGEYNGKFMVSQMVLRGGSIATPQGHARPTYRNFFYPHQRWQFTGLRLAGDQP